MIIKRGREYIIVSDPTDQYKQEIDTGQYSDLPPTMSRFTRQQRQQYVGLQLLARHEQEEQMAENRKKIAQAAEMARDGFIRGIAPTRFGKATEDRGL
jgi:hypothetical protein